MVSCVVVRVVGFISTFVGEGDLETDEIIEDIAEIEDPLEADLWRGGCWYDLWDLDVEDGIWIDKSFWFLLDSDNDWYLWDLEVDEVGLDLGESSCDWKSEDIINESDDDELETCVSFGGVWEDNRILDIMESVIVPSDGIANLPHDSQLGNILLRSDVLASYWPCSSFIKSQRHSSWQVSPQFSSINFSTVENLEDSNSSQKQHFSFTKDFLFLGVLEVKEDWEYMNGFTFGGVEKGVFDDVVGRAGAGGVVDKNRESLLGIEVVLIEGFVVLECIVGTEDTGVAFPVLRLIIGDDEDSSSDEKFK